MSPMFASSTESTVMEDNEELLPKLIAPQAAAWEYELLYPNIIILIFLHLTSLYGLYLACTTALWSTLIFNCIVHILAGLGVTAGAHRLWAHRAYKAKLPLQILLMIMFTFSLQYTVFDWVRNHRAHHRYSDTDADPYNATRGFFYSHIAWLFVKKHPEIKKRTKYVHMDDIYANPVLQFQKKYAFPFMGTVAMVLPTVIPVYFFGETLSTAWIINVLRFVTVLHITCSINSVLHKWGYKPYDKHIKPTQNLYVCFLALGEGFHNYHHVYPWDYRTGEYGNNWLNYTTKFIDFFALIGWAYDLKIVSDGIAKSKSRRTGDGTDMWGYKVDDNKND